MLALFLYVINEESSLFSRHHMYAYTFKLNKLMTLITTVTDITEYFEIKTVSYYIFTTNFLLC